MTLTEEQIDKLTNLFRETLILGERCFTCQWYEPIGLTDGLIKTVKVNIWQKETEFI